MIQESAPLFDERLVASPIQKALADLPGQIADGIEAALARDWDWRPEISVRIDLSTALAPRDLVIERTGGERFLLTVPVSMNWQLTGAMLRERAVCYLLQVRRAPEARRICVTIADGHLPGTYRFAPSSALPHVTLLPDPYFLRGRGYAEAEAAFAAAPDWDDRDDELVWRGAPNGSGDIATEPAALASGGLMPRIRLVLMCKGSEIDAGFVFPKTQPYLPYAPLFEAAGMLRPRVDRFDWARHQFALDIDGNTNAWDNFMIRLKLGCCVLKVDSAQGYRQWYYDRLVPWEHYVPVKADMSDLFEQYDWVRSHPDKARAIAAAGREVAAAMTLDGEISVGARLIEARWNG